MNKPIFTLIIDIDTFTFKRGAWSILVMPVNNGDYTDYEHSLFFSSYAQAAYYIRTLKNLGAELHIHRGDQVTNIFDAPWDRLLQLINS